MIAPLILEWMHRSTGICNIEENAEILPPAEGFFVDEEGNHLGKHKGIIHYTVGQRKGLGLALGYPAYVKAIHPEKNEVVIGDGQSLYRNSITCGDLNYMGISGLQRGEILNCRVKVRYHHPPQEAVVEAIDRDRVRISFPVPVRAPAPGQSAVFYDQDGCVLGGGIILET